jgi:hypothetical protein
VNDAHDDTRPPPASVSDTSGHRTGELNAEQILDLIPREELHALLAGAADRRHRPTVPDDLDALRARLEHLQAATGGTTPATITGHEEAQQPWDNAAELDDTAELAVDDAGDEL